MIGCSHGVPLRYYCRKCYEEHNPKRRECIREDHIVHHAGGKTQDVWVYHYNDGTEEAVIGCWK